MVVVVVSSRSSRSISRSISETEPTGMVVPPVGNGPLHYAFGVQLSMLLAMPSRADYGSK